MGVTFPPARASAFSRLAIIRSALTAPLPTLDPFPDPESGPPVPPEPDGVGGDATWTASASPPPSRSPPA